MHPLQSKIGKDLRNLIAKIKTSGSESITGVWVDPQEFNALENGAPYFPEARKTKTAKVACEEPNTLLERLVANFIDVPSHKELGVLVPVLRAAAIVHQTHHWQTAGSNFYGDHLLFERIYNESVGAIDSLAERAVGLGGINQVNPNRHAAIMTDRIMHWSGDGPSLVERSWYVEAEVLGLLKAAIKSLELKGQLSDGTDNLLQGVCDKHEEFTYLLQQRSATYDFR